MALFLSIGVVKLRGRHKVSVGDGGQTELLHSMRAFGNFIEYATFGLVLLLGLELNQAPTWFIHVCGLSLLVGRILHAIAFTATKSPDSHMKFRVSGMILTYTSLTFSGIGTGVFALLNARP